MKTDPLEGTKEKLKKIKEFDEEDMTKTYNVFTDPFNSKAIANKKPELSVHELEDGNIYAVCCTGTQSKTSLYNWTKFLELENKSLRDKLIVFRIKEKSTFLANPEMTNKDQA
jgi:signaling intermediate in Toll pathway protein